MDKEYLKKHNLTKAHQQFMRLAEGYLSTSMMEEADDDQTPDQNGEAGNMPPMDADANGMPPMDGSGQQPPMGGQEAPQGDENTPPMGGGAPQGPDAAPEGDMPPMDAPDGGQTPIGDDMPPVGPEDELKPEEDDEVIDVEDLTNAQEKLNKKSNMIGKDLGQLDDRIESLLTAVEKMKGIIDHNNNEITNLKAELQKRVPTQTERLNLRGLDSYPFNVNPQDYWKEKNKDGNYEAIFDNQQPTQKEYVIKASDVDDYTPSEIEKSFDDDLNQTMEKIFKGF